MTRVPGTVQALARAEAAALALALSGQLQPEAGSGRGLRSRVFLSKGVAYTLNAHTGLGDSGLSFQKYLVLLPYV